MAEHRVLLDAAAFMDSQHARAVGQLTAADVRTIVQRFLAACYDDLGRVPRLVEGDDMALLLRDLLPRHFGVRDPLAAATEPVLEAYLAFLQETQMVPAAFEQRQALAAHAGEFRRAVAAGDAHRDGLADVGTARQPLYRGSKVGRNDPCPCGSGKKFKNCCLRLGS